MSSYNIPDAEEKKQKILAMTDPKHHSLIEKAFEKPGDMTEEESQKLEELVAKVTVVLPKSVHHCARLTLI